MVKRRPCKTDSVGSIPSSSAIGCCSAMVTHLLGKEGIASSILAGTSKLVVHSH